MNVSQAGAAAGTATRFPVNRERTASLLGFDTTARNTRDASVNHDYIWGKRRGGRVCWPPAWGRSPMS